VLNYYSIIHTYLPVGLFLLKTNVRIGTYLLVLYLRYFILICLSPTLAKLRLDFTTSLRSLKCTGTVFKNHSAAVVSYSTVFNFIYFFSGSGSFHQQANRLK